LLELSLELWNKTIMRVFSEEARVGIAEGAAVPELA